MTRLTVGGTLVRDGKILLGLRSKTKTYYPSVWDVFGGHIESGEAPETALVRELKEELGVDVETCHLLARTPEPDVEKYGVGMCYLFSIEEWSGEPENTSGEHDEIRWFSKTDLVEIKYTPFVVPKLYF